MKHLSDGTQQQKCPLVPNHIEEGKQQQSKANRHQKKTVVEEVIKKGGVGSINQISLIGMDYQINSFI